jgi:hypothetical protein
MAALFVWSVLYRHCDKTKHRYNEPKILDRSGLLRADPERYLPPPPDSFNYLADVLLPPTNTFLHQQQKKNSTSEKIDYTPRFNSPEKNQFVQ